MYIAVGILAAIGLYVIRLINSSIVTTVKRLQNTDELLEKVASIEDVEFKAAYEETACWADGHGFTLEIFFLLHSSNSGEPVKCISWWSEEHSTYLIFYLAEEGEIINKAVDFHTNLAAETSLTTCSSADGLLLPRVKNDFMQCKVCVSLDQQFQDHLKSVASIKSKVEQGVLCAKLDLFDNVARSVKAQADYIMRLPLWKHRGFYWYFVRRNLLKYRSY